MHKVYFFFFEKNNRNKYNQKPQKVIKNSINYLHLSNSAFPNLDSEHDPGRLSFLFISSLLSNANGNIIIIHGATQIFTKGFSFSLLVQSFFPCILRYECFFFLMLLINYVFQIQIAYSENDWLLFHTVRNRLESCQYTYSIENICI